MTDLTSKLKGSPTKGTDGTLSNFRLPFRYREGARQDLPRSHQFCGHKSRRFYKEEGEPGAPASRHFRGRRVGPAAQVSSVGCLSSRI